MLMFLTRTVLFEGIQGKDCAKKDSQSRFWKARPVALARRPAVERELYNLQKEGVKQVLHSE